MRSLGPYDRTARENIAATLYQQFRDLLPLGSIERSHLILQILLSGFPTPTLSAAYFENLDRLLAGKPRLKAPGRIVLGMGSGRCGSTSLAGLLTTVDGSCCTHENPPGICWEPLEEQLAFHMRRFERLAQLFPLVFDASHWWLNAADRFFDCFPDGRVIGLSRDIEACTRSFMKIMGTGRGSLNHWVPPANHIWRPDDWFPFYPTYPMPSYAERDPDGAKAEVIRRYIRDYNERLQDLATRFAGRVMLIRTEELAEPAAQRMIFDFVGLPGKASQMRLNAETIADGVSRTYRF
jgi:hypothetical protein